MFVCAVRNRPLPLHCETMCTNDPSRTLQRFSMAHDMIQVINPTGLHISHMIQHSPEQANQILRFQAKPICFRHRAECQLNAILAILPQRSCAQDLRLRHLKGSTEASAAAASQRNHCELIVAMHISQQLNDCAEGSGSENCGFRFAGIRACCRHALWKRRTCYSAGRWRRGR